MKVQTAKLPAHAVRGRSAAQGKAKTGTASNATAVESGRVSPELARRVLYGMMVLTIVMPVAGSMTRVALPVIRDDFQISADMTAWIATAFTLPFMVLMPLYGRLSDAVGKRRLLLVGIVIFSIGTAMTFLSASLGWLMAGRAVQGVGASGLTPLAMAFISTVFAAKERGKALGTWSQVGPLAAFAGPLAGGVIVVAWGWRAAFLPPLVLGVLAFVAIYHFVPPGLSHIEPGFLRRFDWFGVVLLAAAGTSLLFYLSSRPITGVAPLMDWRLLATTIALFALLVWWERRREDPFMPVDIFRDQVFLRASGAASMRMVVMSGMGFLIPLYLVDVYELGPAAVGVMLMINPGAMALMVRWGGQIADRWGSRWPVVIGLSVQASTAIFLFLLPAATPIWVVGLILAYHGLGAGLMLAALHRAAMGNTREARMGSVAGMYSMLRFGGAAVGTALAGVVLQHFLDQGLSTLDAYQWTFLCFASAALAGVLIGFMLHEPQNA